MTSMLMSSGLNAQCTTPSFGVVAEYGSFTEFSMSSIGQTFTACQDGEITSISIRISSSNTYSGSVNLYLGDEPGDGGTKLEDGSPYTSFPILSGGQVVVIDLSSNPFAVLNGQVYRLELERNAVSGNNIRVDLQNAGPEGPYLEGDYVTNGGAYQAFRDINFAVSITNPAPIPTLSDWGIIILSFIMLILGLVTVRQKQLSMS